MSSHGRRVALLASVLALVMLAGLAAQGPAGTFGVGRTPSPDEIAAFGLSIGPGGEHLPPGSATAREGRAVYERRCAGCHGATGVEGPDDRLAGGIGTLASDNPVRTVGSYWPYATTVWDYVNRAMPFDQPGALTPDEVYGATAYVLFLNGIVDEDTRLDATTLPQVRMPNRDGFVPDPRPDTGG